MSQFQFLGFINVVKVVIYPESQFLWPELNVLLGETKKNCQHFKTAYCYFCLFYCSAIDKMNNRQN